MLNRKLVALGLVLALMGVEARAQQVGNGAKTQPVGTKMAGVYMADTTGRLIHTNYTGDLRTEEVSPPMDANLTFTNVINTQFRLKIGEADSSAVLDTHRMRLGSLWLKGVIDTVGGDTSGVSRVAFQIRGHLNGAADSSSTFALYAYGTAPSNVATSVASDTSSQGQTQTGFPVGAVLATPTSNLPWSGEFVVNFQAKRQAHGSSISVNGHTYYYPNGIWIPLSSIFGRDPYSPYVSIRARVLSGSPIRLTAHLVGTPL